MFKVGDTITRDDHDKVKVVERLPEFLWDPYIKVRHTLYVLEEANGHRFGVDEKACEDNYKKVG